MLIIVKKYDMLRFRICAFVLGTCSLNLWGGIHFDLTTWKLETTWKNRVRDLAAAGVSNRLKEKFWRIVTHSWLSNSWSSSLCPSQANMVLLLYSGGGPSGYHISPTSRFLKSDFLEDFALLTLPFSGAFYHQVHRTKKKIAPITNHSSDNKVYSEGIPTNKQMNKQSIKHK